MTQIRTFLLLAPLLAGLVCWLAVRSFLRGLEGEENAQVEGSLVVAYQGTPAQLDLLGMPDRVSREVSELVLEPLIRVDEGGKLEPVLARSWSMLQTTRFYLKDEIVAQEAALILDEAPKDKRDRWGLESVMVDKTELIVELARPSETVQEEIIVFFGTEKLALLPRVRVEIEKKTARDYHAFYLENAVGREQIRDVRFEGDSAYELLVSGEIEPFLEELTIFYGSDEGSVLKSLDQLEPLRWVDEIRVAFELDQERDWHDGEQFDAEDVLFTYESLCSLPENDGRAQPFRGIEEARLIGDYRIEFVYDRYYSPAIVSWAGVRMLPRHFLGDPDATRWPMNASSRMPGTGNFRVLGHGNGGELVLKAWADGEESGYEQVRLLPINDTLRRRAALEVGSIDLYLPEQPELGALSENLDLQLSFNGVGTWTLVAWNLEKELLSDVRVRAALAKAVDVNGLLLNGLSGMGRRIERIVPLSVGEVPLMKQPEFSKEDAAADLTEAGWKLDKESKRAKDGQRLEFRLLTNSEDPAREMIARELAKAWGEIGVEVEVVVLPWAEVLSAQVEPREFDAVLLGLEKSKGWDLRHLWASGANVSGYQNAEVDALLDLMCTAHEPEKIRESAARMQELIAQDHPCLFLFEGEIPTVYLPRSGMLKVRAGRDGWPWWRGLQYRGDSDEKGRS